MQIQPGHYEVIIYELEWPPGEQIGGDVEIPSVSSAEGEGHVGKAVLGDMGEGVGEDT